MPEKHPLFESMDESRKRKYNSVHMLTAPKDPNELPQRTPKPLYRRLAIGTLVVMGLLLAFSGILAVVVAFSPGETLHKKVASLLLVAIILCLLGRVAWVMGRRKWRTGYFRPSEQERRAMLAKAAAQNASPRWRMGYTVFWCVLAVVWAFLPIFAIRMGRANLPLFHWVFYPVLSAIGIYTAMLQIRLLYRKPTQV